MWKKFFIFSSIAVGLLLFWLRRSGNYRSTNRQADQPQPNETPKPPQPVVVQNRVEKVKEVCGVKVTWDIVYNNDSEIDAQIITQIVNAFDSGTQKKYWYGDAANWFSQPNVASLSGPNLVIFGKIIAAQSRHETCNYLSRICNVNNNFFGMGCATTRQNSQLGCLTSFAEYGSLTQSVQDLTLWFNARSGTWKSGFMFNMIGLINQGKIDEAINFYADHIKNGTTFSYYQDTVANYSRGMRAAYKRIGNFS